LGGRRAATRLNVFDGKCDPGQTGGDPKCGVVLTQGKEEERRGVKGRRDRGKTHGDGGGGVTWGDWRSKKCAEGEKDLLLEK